MTASRDEIEANVVGSALLLAESDSPALGEMLEAVTPQDFALETWRTAWASITKRHEQGLAVDAASIAGGDDDLAVRLVTAEAQVPSMKAGPKYARELAQLSKDKRLRTALREADRLIAAGDREGAAALLSPFVTKAKKGVQRFRTVEIDASPLRKPDWLLKGWLMKGCLHMIAGRPGCGKSTVLAALVAGLSHGRGPLGDAIEPRHIRWLSVEEHEDIVTARLYVSGAAPANAKNLSTDVGPLSLPRDMATLKEEMGGLDLLVIDGLGYSVGGRSESYQAVGELLAGLASIAAETGCAIIGIAHAPKGTGNSDAPVIGSTAWTSVSRVVWVVGDAPATGEGENHERILAVAKTNFKKPESLSFVLSEDIETELAVAVNFRSSNVAASDLMAAPEERSERDDLAGAIRVILADGPIARGDLTKRLKAEGFTAERHAVSRAIKAVGAVSRPGEFGGPFVVELADRVEHRVVTELKGVTNVPMCQSVVSREFAAENEADSPEWQSGRDEAPQWKEDDEDPFADGSEDDHPPLTADEIRENVSAAFPNATELPPVQKRPRPQLPTSAGPDDVRLWAEIRFWLDWETEPVTVTRLMSEFRDRGEANVGRVLHLAGLRFEAGRAVIDWETEREVSERA
ncbi:AAA family ATPase [Ferrimicrobium sp.]|uniref:AAA family ATPase n=1 Tax=Ferrimicrobium sp. TaxID=2926050 RepID=UPI00261DF506|nr:AAA family ATPase [Ferrimicrobium sp.]